MNERSIPAAPDVAASAPAAISPNTHSEAKTANIIYILFLATFVVGVSELVGVIMAYVNREDAPGWIQTHYRYQIRTFWIGMMFVAVGVITLFFVIGWFVLLFFVVWYIVRTVKGMKLLAQGAPIPNPTIWLW
jgi:uncharacterized membrane protein